MKLESLEKFDKGQNQYLVEDILIPHFGTRAPLIGVEIGVLGASGSSVMLDMMPNLTLYSIDPYKYIPDGVFMAAEPQAVNDKICAEAKEKLAGFGDRSILIRDFSDNAVTKTPPVVDFVFVDGDHRYEQVRKDIDNYMPKIREGGIIAGHDFLLQTGVVRAVYETFQAEAVYFGPDFLWWAKR